MIQEYLLNDNEDKNMIERYKPDGVKTEIFSIVHGNNECWRVKYSINSDSEMAAGKLSDIDDYVKNHYKVTVLESGSSVYYNKKLYLLVSGFECKLRKLLYIKSTINKSDKAEKNISDLEKKDLGQIFKMLFIDPAFVDYIKEEVKKRNNEFFSKAELAGLIEETDENTLWDELVGEDCVPLLREKFQDVRKYRNEVMHSHLTSKKRYQEIRRLYKKINSQLDKVLLEVSNEKTAENVNPKDLSFNDTLSLALESYAQATGLSESINLIKESVRDTLNIFVNNEEVRKANELAKSVRKAILQSPEIKSFLEQVSMLSKILLNDPGITAALESMSSVADSTKLMIESNYNKETDKTNES